MGTYEYLSAKMTLRMGLVLSRQQHIPDPTKSEYPQKTGKLDY